MRQNTRSHKLVSATNANPRASARLREKETLDDLLAKFRAFLLSIDEEKSRLRERLEREYPGPLIGNDSTSNSTTSDSRNSNSRKSSSLPTSNSAIGRKGIKTWSFKLLPSSLTSNSSPSSTPVSISAPYNCQTNFHSIYNSSNSSGSKMTTMAGRGCLIVVEGVDRAGKSTLVKNLVNHLASCHFKVDYLRFPDRTTPIGKIIDQYLKNDHNNLDDRAVHLLYSANRWEFDKVIRKRIENGTTMILDRYVYSGVAYSVAKKDMDFEWCLNCDVGLPKPDMVVYLEASRQEQALREGFGDERFERSDFQDKIRDTYEKLIRNCNEQWLRVDVNNKSPDEVLDIVIAPLRKQIERAARRRLDNVKFNFTSYD